VLSNTNAVPHPDKRKFYCASNFTAKTIQLRELFKLESQPMKIRVQVPRHSVMTAFPNNSPSAIAGKSPKQLNTPCIIVKNISQAVECMIMHVY